MTWKQALVVMGIGLSLVALACYAAWAWLPGLEFALSALGIGLGLAGTGSFRLVQGKVWPGRDDVAARFLTCLLWAGSVSVVASGWIPTGYDDLVSAMMAEDAGVAGFLVSVGLVLVAVGFLGRLLWGLWQTRQ